METWDLAGVVSEDGSTPVVLASQDGARAIAVLLGPGEELGEHQVRERAWLLVVEGEVRVEVRGARLTSGRAGWSRSIPASATPCEPRRAPGSCFCSPPGPPPATTASTSTGASPSRRVAARARALAGSVSVWPNRPGGAGTTST